MSLLKSHQEMNKRRKPQWILENLYYAINVKDKNSTNVTSWHGANFPIGYDFPFPYIKEYKTLQGKEPYMGGSLFQPQLHCSGTPD